MVVNQYLGSLQLLEFFLDAACTTELVEIKDKKGVRRIQDSVTKFSFFVINVDRVGTREPSQEARKVIRDHYFDMVSEFLEKL